MKFESFKGWELSVEIIDSKINRGIYNGGFNKKLLEVKQYMIDNNHTLVRFCVVCGELFEVTDRRRQRCDKHVGQSVWIHEGECKGGAHHFMGKRR